jgi:glycosyltransferase involved in cell wall biosynthesis
MTETVRTRPIPGPSSPRPEHDLTVIIPAFGCAPYLPAAVHSVLHNPVAAILIADDGSGLEVPRIAAQLESAHPTRIRLLRSRRRRGVAKNVNDAVDHVKTPYFAKLDGDDVLIPGHLAAAFRIIADRPGLAIIAGHEKRIEAGESLVFRPEAFPEPQQDAATTILSGTDAFRFILNWRPNPCSSGAIYRTDAFREIGGFDPSIKWGEDWEIWFRFAQRYEVAYRDAPSALYRIHDQSATAWHARNNRVCCGYDAVYRSAAAICRDPEIAAMLRRAFLRVAGLYGKAAVKQTLQLRNGGLECAWRALRALISSVRLPDGGSERQTLARSKAHSAGSGKARIPEAPQLVDH